MRSICLFFHILLLSLLGSLAASQASADVSFVHNIAPIVLRRCTGCHGERTNLGGYRAHNFQSLMKFGGSGKPPITPGRPDASLLFQMITSKSPATRMPQSDDPLAPAQIEAIRQWIVQGAKFDGADPTATLKSLLGPRKHPSAPAAYHTAVPVLALAFVPGGKEVAVGGYNEITLWDTATGALTRRIAGLPQRIQALAFSHDGKQLLVGGGTPGEYGEVTRIDLASGQRKVLDTFSDIVLAVSFSPDGKRIVAGGADASVRAYDWETGKRIWTSKVHSDWVTSVSFSFDGHLVASASKDMTVKLYLADTGELFTTYTGHNRQLGAYAGQSPVYAVRFAPDARLAYSAGGGRWIHFWDPEQVKKDSGDAGDQEDRFAKESHTKYIEHGFTKEVFALVVEKGQIFAASADGGVKQFDLATQKEVRSYTGNSDWVFSMDYDPVAHRVASGAFDGSVHIWDTLSGTSIVVFKAQPRAVAAQVHTASARSAAR